MVIIMANNIRLNRMKRELKAHQWQVSILTFILTIPAKFCNFNTLRAILTLPKAFFLMFLSLLKIRGANKKFIHTEHGTND